jgi:hypothetical protein
MDPTDPMAPSERNFFRVICNHASDSSFVVKGRILFTPVDGEPVDS